MTWFVATAILVLVAFAACVLGEKWYAEWARRVNFYHAPVPHYVVKGMPERCGFYMANDDDSVLIAQPGVGSALQCWESFANCQSTDPDFPRLVSHYASTGWRCIYFEG